MLTWIIIFPLLAFPPILLAVKFFKKKPSGWLFVFLVVLYLALGWALVVFAFVAEQLRISELIQQGRDDELPPGWDVDGASGLFAVFGGWLFPLANLLVWIAVYALAVSIRPLFASTQWPKTKAAISAVSSIAVVITRWLLFAQLVVLLIGAFKESEYITGVTALIFCLFLAVHQRKVVAYTERPYFLVFAVFAMLFLFGFYLDAKDV